MATPLEDAVREVLKTYEWRSACKCKNCRAMQALSLVMEARTETDVLHLMDVGMSEGINPDGLPDYVERISECIIAAGVEGLTRDWCSVIVDLREFAQLQQSTTALKQITVTKKDSRGV